MAKPEITRVVPIALLLVLSAIPATVRCQTASERRSALIQHAAKGAEVVPRLAAALQDENPVVRRAAVRLLAKIGEPAKAALSSAMDNSDFVTRMVALRAACDLSPAAAVPCLKKAMGDENAVVRKIAVENLSGMRPHTAEVTKLLEVARKDKDQSIRNLASRALWPFHRDAVSIRNRTDYDHDVKVTQTIPLPKDNWKFKLDPDRDGHLKKWYEPAFDDSKWDTIAIEQAWQKAGYQYIGVTWYRRTIKLPAKPKHVAVDLHFKGVDECAWVWVNGQYVGQHDIGPSGWDKPFLLDATKEVKWGEDNQITVRAMNTAHAGGIWRPVQIEVLQ